MTNPSAEEHPTLLTPGQAAKRAGVNPKTLSRWADMGLLDTVRTLGGHRRINADSLTDALILYGKYTTKEK